MTSRRSIGTVPAAALVALAIAVVLGLSIAVAFDRVALGLEVAGLALLPALLYVCYRWPIVFPLGLYIVLVPFDPLLKVSSGGGATLTRFIGVITILALLVHAFRLRRLFAPPNSWYAWAAYNLLCVLSLAWSINGETTLDLIAIMGALFALYTMTAIYPITPATYALVRRTVIISGSLTAFYGFYGYVTGQRLNATRLSLSQGNNHYDPNHYAASFCLPIALVAADVFFGKRSRERVLPAIFLFAMFANVLLSGSRGGLIAATLLIFYVGLRARAYALLAITSFLGFGFSFLLPNVWTRIMDPTQGDASGRGEIWSVGFAIIREYGIFGAGFGAFQTAYNENINHSIQRLFAGYGRPAHNIVIQTTAELGIAGIVILLTAWAVSFRENAFIPRLSAYFRDRCAYEGAIIGIFTAALTIDLLWFKYLWLCLSTIAMLKNVVRPTLLFGRRIATPRPQTARRAEAVREPVRL